MTKIDRDLDRILSIILDIQKTQIQYLNQGNRAHSLYVKIWSHVFELKQDFYMRNEKRK